MPLTGRGRASAPTIGNNRPQGGGRTLAVCLLVSAALFTASVRMGSDGPIALAKGAFQTVTTPVRYLGALVATPFSGLGNVVSNLTADQATLSELTAENEQLRSRNAELEEAEQAKERLQGLLDLKDANNLQSTAARIISGSSDSWSSSVQIDKGSSSGLTVGMPVTSSAGVIGQIVECGATSSTVRLITDENSSVSAMVQSSRAQGMLQGSATGSVSLELIRSSQTVNIGDVVVTSGLGGVFPKGLPLGKVTSVENNPGSLYLNVVVDPFAHTEGFEEVLVITSLTEEQQATSDDISSADAQDTTSSSSSSDASTGDKGSDQAATSDKGAGTSGTQATGQ